MLRRVLFALIRFLFVVESMGAEYMAFAPPDLSQMNDEEIELALRAL